MEAEKNHRAGPPKKTRKKNLKWIPVIFVILILLVVFLPPAFVSSKKGQKIILNKINDSVDGWTDFADLSMSWIRGLKVTDISFKDKAGQTSVKVKQLTTKPHYFSILTGTLSFGQTIIDEPRIEINLKDRQPEKVEAPEQKPSAGKSSKPVVLPVEKIDLVVNNGNLKVSGAESETVELSEINSNLNLRPPGQQTSFDINLAVVDKGKPSKISTSGQVTPHKRVGWSLKGTSGDLAVEVSDLDIGSLGPIFVLAGIDIRAEGLLWADLKSDIKDGRPESLSGTIKGRDLDITGAYLKGDRLKTSALDVGIKLQSKEELINIEKLDVKTDFLSANAAGTVPRTVGSMEEFLKPDSPHTLRGNFDCDLAAASTLMPHTFKLKEGMKVTAGKLSGNVETSTRAGQRQIVGQANLAGLAGIVDGKTIALTQPIRADVEITSGKTGVKYDKLNLSASFAQISCTGSSELLKYAADISLTELQNELGRFIDTGPYTIAGQLHSKGEVSIKEGAVAAAGSSTVKDFYISSAKQLSAFEPKADISFSAIFKPNENVFNIDFIKADASFGQVSIKDGALALDKEADKPIELTVSAKEVDLEKIRPFAIVLGALPKEMELAGIVESNVSVSSEKGVYRIITDATNIKNLKVSYPQQEPFEQKQVSVVFDAEVNPVEKTIALGKLQLESDQIKISKGNLNQVSKDGKTRFEGRLECEYDWTAVSAMAGPRWPTGLKLEGQRKDTLSFAGEYPDGKPKELLKNLNTKAKLGFERAEYMGLNFEPTEVDIQVQNGLLKIAPFSTTVNKGQLQFAGEADFKKKPTLLKTPQPIHVVKDVHIDDEVAAKLLVSLNPIFAEAVGVSGIADFDCNNLAIPIAGGQKEDLEIAGKISMREINMKPVGFIGTILSTMGTARGQNMVLHPTEFTVKNGYVKYDNMQVDIGDNPVNFSGVLPLNPDKQIENMTVTLPYTFEGRTVETGEETSSRRITAKIKGTPRQPELDLGDLAKEALKERLKEEVEEELGEIGTKILEGLLK